MTEEMESADTNRSDNPKWPIHENLLQSYRRIFISSQSFLLAVGAILARERIPWLSTTILALAVYMIWWMWFPVVRSRHRIVDFYKFNLERYTVNGWDTHGSKEVAYVRDKSIRASFNAKGKVHTNWRPTRLKIDFVLPCMFTVIWALITYSALRGWLCP